MLVMVLVTFLSHITFLHIILTNFICSGFDKIKLVGIILGGVIIITFFQFSKTIKTG